MMKTKLAIAGGSASAVLAAALGGWWWVVGKTDRVPPDIAIVSPVQNAALYGMVAVEVTATDNIGVQVVRFAVDHHATCVITVSPYICVWDSTAAGQGEHLLSATAYDADNNRRNVTISVTSVPLLEITTTALPGAVVGEAYSAEIRCQGGAPPYTWGVFSGTLPPGLTLTGSGASATLAGTPTAEGQWAFVVAVSDSPTVGTQQMAFLAIGPHEATKTQGVITIRKAT